jgi:hypothetical protein
MMIFQSQKLILKFQACNVFLNLISLRCVEIYVEVRFFCFAAVTANENNVSRMKQLLSRDFRRPPLKGG